MEIDGGASEVPQRVVPRSHSSYDDKVSRVKDRKEGLVNAVTVYA